MCGRFNIANTPGLQGLLDSLGVDLKLPAPLYNIAPTEDIPLIRNGELQWAQWWLTPSWSKSVSTAYSMFNARAETLSKSPAFRGPFKHQRGIVPMSSFIEWRMEDGDKQPWLITGNSEALAVAALWDVWERGTTPLLSCTLVTTEAAEPFRRWHNRMPVMLTEAECRVWLDNEQVIDQGDPMLVPILKYDLQLAPINRAVGNSKNKDLSLLDSIGDHVTLRASGGSA